LDSTDSSGPSAVLKTGARAAAEGAALALAAELIAGRVWSSGPDAWGVRVGLGAAWAASSTSVAWLVWARGRSWKAFWWAFGGGMALRAAVLGGLAWWAYGRETVALEALLMSYAFGLIGLLLTLELRHLRVK
jgi:hypothetical protein